MKIIDEIEILKGKYGFEYKIINDIKAFITEGENNKTSNFITEASFIESKNRYILGVGPINPHEANEYIIVESLNKLVEQYKEFIRKFN
jgi:acetylornithine deacetylase/succinyl-diaminopimelate desuccinylase-like protein